MFSIFSVFSEWWMITESIHYNLHETLKAYDLRLNILYQEKGEKGLIWLNVLVSSPGHTFHHIFRFSNGKLHTFSPISALWVPKTQIWLWLGFFHLFTLFLIGLADTDWLFPCSIVHCAHTFFCVCSLALEVQCAIGWHSTSKVNQTALPYQKKTQYLDL